MSPLGKYSQIVAASAAIIIIVSHILLVGFLKNNDLHDAFLLALGAVFGAGASTAITNGTIKRDVDAIHKRLDSEGVPHDIG